MTVGRDDDRPYVDERVGDLDGAGEAARAAATEWHLEAPTLLRHGMNAIYECGDTVLRVAMPTAPATVSIELADVLDAHGVPSARPARHEVVAHGAFAVTAWDRIVENGGPVDWCEVGAIVKRVHALTPDDLPAGLPLPSPVTFPWWDFEGMLTVVAHHLDPAALDGIRSTIDRHSEWREFSDVVVCHGDVHPGNVMTTDAGPVLIDWDLMCQAPAGWDHGPLMTWTERWGGAPGIYEAFAEGYGWSARGDGGSEAFAELRLVAATLMRVRAAMADNAAAPEADRRLAHWRGDPDAPTWRAQ